MKFIHCIVSCLAIAILTPACSDKPAESAQSLTVSILQPIDSLTAFSDTTFFNNVTAISAHSGGYVLADVKNQRIILIDNHFELVRIIGKEGKGPGEFLAPSFCLVKGTFIYTFDLLLARIVMHNLEGEFKDQMDIAFEKGMHQFAVDDEGNIYFPSARQANSISKVNQKGEILQQFGNTTGDLRARRNLFYLKNGDLIAFSPAVPMVERYDSAGLQL